MPLEPPEVDTIAGALTDSHPTIETLRATLQAIVTGGAIQEIPQGASPIADARGIVVYLDRTDPAALLAVLKVHAPNDADLNALMLRYKAALAAPPPPSPWQERLLWRRAVVLDRGPVRDVLRTLSQTELPNALLVTGPPRSGKTRTAQLVRNVALAARQPCAVVAQGPLAAYEIVQTILAQLRDPKWDDVEQVDSPATHWYRKQCTRLLVAATAAMKESKADRCWIVVDDIGASSGTAVELCDYLLRAVTPAATGVRLVLLGYPRDALPDALDETAVEWDRLKLGQVGEADVRDYLRWLYGEIVKKPLTDDALTSLVNGLIGGVAPDSEGFLDRVRAGLEDRTKVALKGVT